MSAYNKGISPTDIAAMLREKHGYTDDIVNMRTVSDCMSYLKKNGLAKIAPMNTPEQIPALSGVPNHPRDCKFIFLSFYLLMIYLGIDAAQLVGVQYTEQSETSPSDDAPVLSISSQIAESIFASFSNSGFFYTQETEKSWIIILSRYLNTRVSMKDILKDGVKIMYRMI